MTTKAGKKENRGGKRPGAGRPKGSRETLSTRQVGDMLDEAEEKADQEDMTIFGVLLGFIYDSKASLRDRTACIKLALEHTVPKIQEGGEADQVLGPAVFLPEQHPRLEVIEGGKKDKDGDEESGD